MVAGSPACHPQATLAVVIRGISSSSAPSLHFPKLSPQSQLMSIAVRIASPYAGSSAALPMSSRSARAIASASSTETESKKTSSSGRI